MQSSPNRSGDSQPQPKATRRELVAWAMYDWANSAYSTISITVLVIYLRSSVDSWLDEEKAGDLVWSWGIGLTMLVAACLSPVVGAIADAHATKIRWLAGTAFCGAAATALMIFATPERTWLLVLLFLIVQFNFELSLCFYNGFLPEIADDESIGRVSSWGYILGYLGGGLALLLVLALFSFGYLIGLPTLSDNPEVNNDPTALLPRIALCFTGLWWGIFTVPTILVLRHRENPQPGRASLLAAGDKALREVKTTIRNLRRFRTLALFLLAFLVFNDGVQTVISQASVYAEETVKLSNKELLSVILMIQFLAMPGAWAVGCLADWWSHKGALISCLVVWIALLCAAFYVTEVWHFWLLAIAVALVLGGTQSVSRALMGLMTPENHAAEFFGFFNLSGKATSVFGPIFFGTVLYQTGSPYLALGSLTLFFAVGLSILAFVNVARGRDDARQAEQSTPETAD